MKALRPLREIGCFADVWDCGISDFLFTTKITQDT